MDAKNNKKPFYCNNGRVYMFPANHCVFCANCADIVYDFTHGPYLFMCDFGYCWAGECCKFKEET